MVSFWGFWKLDWLINIQGKWVYDIIALLQKKNGNGNDFVT